MPNTAVLGERCTTRSRLLTTVHEASVSVTTECSSDSHTHVSFHGSVKNVAVQSVHHYGPPDLPTQNELELLLKE